MKRRVGFTLIELIVVIAILGIIAVMTIPNTGYFEALREKEELKEFKRDILYIRNKAIIDNGVYRVRFLPQFNGYILQPKDDFAPVIKRKYFKSGIELSTGEGSKEVLFNGNGTTSKAGSIYFYGRNNKKYKLTITPVRGLVKIEPID